MDQEVWLRIAMNLDYRDLLSLMCVVRFDFGWLLGLKKWPVQKPYTLSSWIDLRKRQGIASNLAEILLTRASLTLSLVFFYGICRNLLNVKTEQFGIRFPYYSLHFLCARGPTFSLKILTDDHPHDQDWFPWCGRTIHEHIVENDREHIKELLILLLVENHEDLELQGWDRKSKRAIARYKKLASSITDQENQ